MSARFICENCKYEVSLDGDRCPFCGKEFYAVYCPRCKHEGLPGEFRNGCPRCGYLKQAVMAYRRRHRRRNRQEKTYFPRWLYTTAIMALLLGIVGLIVYIALVLR
ncbi:MAG: hypothetical protein JXD23_15765 [Spirochaetales bacterium]|nr:hypothetical protein [Spirochaetales bacterium]